MCACPHLQLLSIDHYHGVEFDNISLSDFDLQLNRFTPPSLSALIFVVATEDDFDLFDRLSSALTIKDLELAHIEEYGAGPEFASRLLHSRQNSSGSSSSNPFATAHDADSLIPFLNNCDTLSLRHLDYANTPSTHLPLLTHLTITELDPREANDFVGFINRMRPRLQALHVTTGYLFEEERGHEEEQFAGVRAAGEALGIPFTLEWNA